MVKMVNAICISSIKNNKSCGCVGFQCLLKRTPAIYECAVGREVSLPRPPGIQGSGGREEISLRRKVGEGGGRWGER